MIVMNRTRDQFIAVLGHDLRSPLSAIFMSAGLLVRGRDGNRLPRRSSGAASGWREWWTTCST